MTKRIEVRSQAQFDACIKAGNIAVVIGCRVVAWGNSSVVARENSSVVAWGNSSVVARENSSVEAWGNVFIRLFCALKIKASAHVVVMLHGEAKKIIGGKRIKANKPKTPKSWCDHHGVKTTNGVATLFKAVDEDYSTSNARKVNIFYKPGEVPVALDWDGGKAECGGGLHFSPAPSVALSFNPNAKKFVACPVKLKDISVHPDGYHPYKVKARGCCAPVYEVDRKGNRMKPLLTPEAK
mgnify:CR=1 FL=1